MRSLLRHLLVGDNAFIGVSHLSQSQAREKIEQFSVEDVARVLNKAAFCGATGFTFTVHPTNFSILGGALADASVAKFELWPILPYAAGYVRLANEKGIIGLVNEITSHLSSLGKVKALTEGGISALTMDPMHILNSYVNLELSRMRELTSLNIKAVLLHEVVTDLGVAFQSRALFDSYIHNLREKYDIVPGFVTRNLVKFTEFFQQTGLSLDGLVIMTPFNRIGFQMNPSKLSCETCLSELEGSIVIAMSVLAGGYVPLGEAISYVQTLANISGVAIGVSSVDHAEKTFTALRNAQVADSAAMCPKT